MFGNGLVRDLGCRHGYVRGTREVEIPFRIDLLGTLWMLRVVLASSVRSNSQIIEEETSDLEHLTEVS